MRNSTVLFHAGIITTAPDTAWGYAAFSLMPVLIEFKTNLLAPARGFFRARVLKPGQTITLGEAQAFAVEAGRRNWSRR
jgi:acyl-coenzyme A thioesterase PaaI-like protein